MAWFMTCFVGLACSCGTALGIRQDSFDMPMHSMRCAPSFMDCLCFPALQGSVSCVRELVSSDSSRGSNLLSVAAPSLLCFSYGQLKRTGVAIGPLFRARSSWKIDSQ